MRRQRQRLQVSTFPFLAVLLCAMGALILFLLVMDRRAHIVAKQKAMNTLAALEQEEEHKFIAEVEARKKEQHNHLALQHQQAVQERQSLSHRAGSVQQQIKENERTLHELRQRLASYAAATKQAQTISLQQRAAFAQAKNDESAAQAKLVRLTAELEQLENALKQLKTANEKPTEVVALTPYRGTQGDNRRPIYLECRGDSYTLHPEPLTLRQETPALELRQAVEKRLGASNSSYVMFLVRPDGIALYYRALAALEGLKIDFGYELVDRDWVLALSMPEEGDGSGPTKRSAPAPLVLDSTASARPATSGGPMKVGAGSPGVSFSVDGERVARPESSKGVTDVPSKLPTPFGVPQGVPPGLPSTSVSGGPDLPSAGEPKGTEVSAPRRFPAKPASAGVNGGPELPSSSPSGAGSGVSKGVAQQPAVPSTGGASPSSSVQTQEPTAAPAELTFRPAKPAPPPVGRLLGNRDLTLVLECTREGVVFPTANELYPLNSLRRDPKGDHPLAVEIKQLIARRQASVLTGEAPYQPSIRFRIQPDGLRAYYLVYPLLENLRIPMTRENVE